MVGFIGAVGCDFSRVFIKEGFIMSIKATIAKHYRLRIGVMAGFMLIACLMFFNDGYYAYPEEGRAYNSYMALKAELEENGTSDELISEWVKIATENEWEKEGPLLKDRSELDVTIQLVISAGTAVAFLFFAFKLLKTVGNWVAIDDKEISSSSAGSFAFGDVVEIDKSRWKKKGIAYIVSSNGKKILLDNWIFDQEPTDSIMRKLEDNINHDIIQGGIAEVDEVVEDSDDESEEDTGSDKTSE